MRLEDALQKNPKWHRVGISRGCVEESDITAVVASNIIGEVQKIPPHVRSTACCVPSLGEMPPGRNAHIERQKYTKEILKYSTSGLLVRVSHGNMQEHPLIYTSASGALSPRLFE